MITPPVIPVRVPDLLMGVDPVTPRRFPKFPVKTFTRLLMYGVTQWEAPLSSMGLLSLSFPFLSYDTLLTSIVLGLVSMYTWFESL